jgi:hypothetical protein
MQPEVKSTYYFTGTYDLKNLEEVITLTHYASRQLRDILIYYRNFIDIHSSLVKESQSKY